MNGAVMQFAAIITLLGVDSVLDIKTREIPDWISGAIVLTAFLNFDVRSLWGLIVALIFFSVALFTGKIGGGDVKLIAALSVRGRTADKALPFVPFIFIGYLCSKLIF